MALEYLQDVSTTTALLGLLLTCLYMVFFLRWWSSVNVPGPWGVPLLGYYPFLKKNYHIQLHELTKKHGEVYRINIAGQEFLYLDTIRAIRDVNVNHSDAFRDRTSKHCVFQKCFEYGLVNLTGDAWHVQRKFFLQGMKESGLSASKDQLKDPVNESVWCVLDILRESKGTSIDLSPVLSKSCTDSVIKLFLGNNIDDKTAESLNDVYLKLLVPMTDLSVMLTGNIARYIVCPWVQGFSDMIENIKKMKKLLKTIIDDHKSTFRQEAETRDFIDCYLKEKALLEKKNDPRAKYFSDDCLIGTLIQSYGDGSSAIGLFVASFLNELSAHPEVQDDIYEEILSFVGSERLPTIEDRSKLITLNAVLKELQRISNLFIIFPGTECAHGTTVFGVKVKKGCIAITNFWSANRDPKIYKNPEKFDHTRFMPGNPKIEHPILFGIGKRVCAGEGLVMAEVFLFLSAILQNFLLIPRTDQTGEQQQYNPLHDGKFEVCAVPRKRGRYGSIA